MVMCLDQGADLHMAQLMPLPLTISWSRKSNLDFLDQEMVSGCGISWSRKSRLVLPSWFYFAGAGSPG